jgi:hypothetical protein
LALQIGHRISEDFDFFRTDDMDARALHDVFKAYGAYETLQEAEHTLTVRLDRTKLSFFCVRDPFLFGSLPYRFFTIADITDIALMKIAAISGRGSRKDFIDLFFILSGPPFLAEKSGGLSREASSAAEAAMEDRMAFLASQGSAKMLRGKPQSASLFLRQILELTIKKYGASRANRYHLLKSLTYFDDAEREPMPQMLRAVDWNACKRFFIQAAQDVIMQLES